MEEKTLDLFLRSLSCDSEYKFLEQGKDDDELKKVCEKSGIAYPNIDLAILKMTYAYVDKTNLNGCVLPREEVEKALPTIAGKAIDFDHIRERIVGYMLSGELVDDKIVGYGAFFKSSLNDDFELIKELFNRNNLAVSFEAWGTREFAEDKKSYNLKDIIFCGLGLLINTKPAFPGAGVVEMANKRVLEFAKIEDKTTFIRSGERAEVIKAEELKQKKLEKARMYSWDMDTIMRMGSEVVCPMCKSQGTIEVNKIDFKGNEMNADCWMCGSNLDITMSPKASIVLKDTASRTVVEVKKVEKMEEKVMEKKLEAPSTEQAEVLIKDEEQVVAESKAEVEAEVVIDEKTETLETVVAEAKAEVVKEEQEASKAEQATLELENLKNEVASLKEKVAKARDEGKVIGERRSFLGEYAKDMSDDDVLDSVKYENASLRKKVAELEAKKEVASVKETPLELGSKEVVKKEEKLDLASKVRKAAWNL